MESSDSSDSDYEDDYQGALQLCLFSADEGIPSGAAPIHNLTGPGAQSLEVKPTLVSIFTSSCTGGRPSGAGGSRDSSLSFVRNLSSSTASPAKRQVRFNSYVTRATFAKLPDVDDESSGYGWERYTQSPDSMPSCLDAGEIDEIEEIAPAMILPPPNHMERGDSILFSPPHHMAELDEHDLVVYERHPNGIRGIQIKRDNQRPSRSLKRSSSSLNLSSSKYDFISKEEIDDLYAREDPEDVDMFGDEAGANKALNSGELFIQGRKAKRTPAVGTTVSTNMDLKDLEWAQVDEHISSEEGGSTKVCR